MSASGGLPTALPRALPQPPPSALPKALPAAESRAAHEARSGLGLRPRGRADFYTRQGVSGLPIGDCRPGRPGGVTLAAALVTFASFGSAGLALARPAHADRGAR